MATIKFKGKNTIWNHHLSVPYHTLEVIPELGHNADQAHGNLIVEGDNLIALKSLLPLYAGKVKCIYIDPPYNTGNESWIYNDKVNSPLIREWLNKEVGKDDLTKHDKWLCMMTPRLKLLRELLNEDGAIFISIDDNEICSLRLLMNELFGEENFVAQICILTNPKGRSQDKYFATNHEYMLVYSKSVLPKGFFAVEKDADQLEEEYTEEDEIGKYRLLELRNTHREFGRHNRKKLFYPFYVNADDASISLQQSNGDIEVYPVWDDGFEGCWAWGKPKAEADSDFLIAQNVKGNWKIYRKSYANGAEKMLKTILTDKLFHTEKGQKVFNELFDTKDKLFYAPKSVDLIKGMLATLTSDNDIILDSFAGSGTTAHAVFDLNQEDGGNRKFVLVQMREDSPQKPDKNVCRDITRERVKRVIERNTKQPVQTKMGEKKPEKIGFEYKRVGVSIDPDSMLAGNLPTYGQLAEYVYYLATGKNLEDKKKVDQTNYFVGQDRGSAIFLIYAQDMDELRKMALTLDIAEAMEKKHKDVEKIVYAPACYLDEDYLDKFRIKFVSVPYNLFERVQ